MNKIKVERKNYMKHTVTDLNDPKETIMFSRSILTDYYFDTFFEELEDELYTANLDKQYKLLHSNQIAKINCTLAYLSNDASIGSSSCTIVNFSFTNHCTPLTIHNLWTLYFDISRNTQGVDVGCLLIDPCGIRTYFSCHLEYKCTEYLIQGLMKEIDLKVKSIEVFGNSRLVIKQVRNFMFSTFDHLNNYQR